MSLWSKTILIFWLSVISLSAFSQDCSLSISGIVIDVNSAEPLAYANIFIKETKAGAVSDSNGQYQLENLCEGNYHLIISHLGCSTLDLYLSLEKDTLLTIELAHNSQMLNEVTVAGEQELETAQVVQTISSAQISRKSHENLSNMLESITGVSTIRQGNNISKPVIHGLSGNRITIMNNGIAQSGQQWGADHSPEIDPLAANKLSVIKGVSALSYPGGGLGSVILVEPGPIGNDPHIHGDARYYFESNGLGNGVNLTLKKYSPTLSWKAGGTLKKSGDNSTPDYFLNNTGAEEANAFLLLERNFGKRWKADVYLSTYNARLGVLRGAHIGNLSDLEAALTRDEPFFTEKNFSYDIDAPSQKVNHHLMKAHTRYQISDTQWLDFTYALQLDYRKEFDVRRGDRSDIPALSLEENTQTIELKYRKYFGENWTLNIGNQSTRIDNVNDPETNILPLIPDYIAYESGVYTTLSKAYSRLSLELGLRYDYIDRRVAAISTTVPREVIRYNDEYHNFAVAGGTKYALTEYWSIAYNIGLAMRSPEVNELYSNGLHQGVGGIEIGDPNLNPEQSFKNTLSIAGTIGKKLNVEGLAYYQQIQNFIYLQPLNEFRLTIRGAFPVFEYQQTTAQIMGMDLAATYSFSQKWNVKAQASLIQGNDLDNDLGLINMPAQSFYGELNYELPNLGKLENLMFQVNARVVLQQNNIAVEQDFIAPPDGYQLLGFAASTDFHWKKKRITAHLEFNNLLNTRYRDYLNRQRYFADDLGFNAIFGLSLAF